MCVTPSQSRFPDTSDAAYTNGANQDHSTGRFLPQCIYMYHKLYFDVAFDASSIWALLLALSQILTICSFHFDPGSR